jgi:hypothetical protein
MSRVTDVDRGYGALLKRAQELQPKRGVRVGLLAAAASKAYPNGRTVLEVGIWNEFGTSRIPPRPFLRSWFDTHRVEAVALETRLTRQVLEGKLSSRQALVRFGLWAVRSLRESTPGTPPPNADSTLRRKATRSTETLRDYGLLLANLTYEIAP